MKLYNTTTGQVAEITKINVNSNLVAYNIIDAENSELTAGETKVHQFKNFTIADEFDNVVSIREKCLEMLQTELLKEFTLEEPSQHWIVTNAVVRMFLDKNWIINDVLIKDEHADLAAIFNREQAENAAATEKFIFIGEKYTTAYFTSVLAEDYATIEPYLTSGQIIMETKNV